MISKLIHNIGNFFTWWLAGLKYLIPKVIRSRVNLNKNKLCANVVRNGVQFFSNETNKSSLFLLKDNSILDKINKWLIDNKFKNADVTLRLDSSLLLVKSLSFPSAANDNLKNIISFEIERHTPFSKDDVYFDYIVSNNNPKNKLIATNLYVIQKEKLNNVIELFRSAGINASSFSIKDNSIEHSLNLIPSSKLANKHDYTQAFNFALGLFALLLITALFITPGFKSSIIASQLADDAQQLRTQTAEVTKVRDELEDSLKKRAYIHQLKKSYPSVITLLSEITDLLPDDTWLNRFEVSNNSVRFQGESNNASRLIEMIEDSANFNETRFMSPITQNPVTNNDRFYITTKLVLQANQDDPI